VCPGEAGTAKGGLKVTETCFAGDEGGSLEIGIQAPVSNHLWVLQTKAVVMSAKEKADLSVR
jgi:hypothetical protein